MTEEILPVGKLDSDILKEAVIDQIDFKREEVITRADVGEDCAVIDFGQYECVVSTDPITAAVEDIGRLSIHISCNDIASNGIQPLGITIAAMLPYGTTRQDIIKIMSQASRAAKNAGVEIIGGHTEITESVNQPVIVSTAFGRCVRGGSQKAQDMRPGDLILMTKEAGLEGAGIIATEHSEELSRVLTCEEIERAKGFLDRVSVIPEGVIAGRIGTSGMHDVTEGGILGAVWEMCNLSGLGAELEQDRIAIDPVTLKIAEVCKIDPYRLISSGCMLIVAKPDKVELMETEFKNSGINFSIIGRVTEKNQGIILKTKEGSEQVRPPEADELYKVCL